MVALRGDLSGSSHVLEPASWLWCAVGGALAQAVNIAPIDVRFA